MPMTRDQMMEIITGQGRGQRAVVVDAPEKARLVLDGTNGLVLHAGGRKGDHPLGDDGAKALTKFIGASPRLLETLPAKLGQQVVTAYLQNTPFGLVLQEDKVVDIQPAANFHYVVAAARVLDTVIEAAGEGATFDRALQVATSKVEVHLAALQDHTVFVPHGHDRINDLVAAGAAVTFSPTGIIAPEVHGYTQRRICTNGLVVTDRGMVFDYSGGDGGGDGRRFWPWLRRSVHDAIQAIGPTIEQFQAMADQAIEPEQRAEVLEGLMNAARLRAGERDTIRAQAVNQPPANLWEALNLVTWLGTHATENPARARAIMAQAGDVARQDVHARLCPLCRHSHAAFN